MGAHWPEMRLEYADWHEHWPETRLECADRQWSDQDLPNHSLLHILLLPERNII